MINFKLYKFLFFVILLFGYSDKLFSMSKVDSYYSLALKNIKSFIHDNRSFLMRDNAKELKIVAGGTAVTTVVVILFIAWLRERNKNNELLTVNKALSTKKESLNKNLGLSFEYIDSINKAAGITSDQFNRCVNTKNWDIYSNNINTANNPSTSDSIK